MRDQQGYLRQATLVLVVAMAFIGVVPQPARAASDEATFETVHFSITYSADPSSPDAPDLSDGDSDGVPDAVERLGAAFEAAWDFEITELGYPPPPEGDLYPVYVVAGGGYTRPILDRSGGSQASFTTSDPSLVRATTTDRVMEQFAVHEFFHAIQNGYDYRQPAWIDEATATWVQDRFQPDAVNYLLPGFVATPRLGLTSTSGYGAWIFFEFLVERFGGGRVAGSDLVKEIWEQMADPTDVATSPGSDPVTAITNVIEAHGGTLPSAWAEFLLWLRRPSHFESGASYRAALVRTSSRHLLRTSVVSEESCKLSSDLSGVALPPLSGDYAKIKPASDVPRSSNVELAFEGSPNTVVAYLVRLRSGTTQEGTVVIGDAGSGTTTIPFGSRSVRSVVVVLPNPNPEEPATLRYSVIVDGQQSTSVTATPADKRVIYGTGTHLSGSAICNGAGASDAHLTIEEHDAITGRVTGTYETTADSRGIWSTVVSPGSNSTYVVVIDDPLLTISSAATDIGVNVFVSLEPSSQRVGRGEPVDITGSTVPAHANVPLIVEYRRPDRQWQLGVTTSTSPDGSYSTSLTLPVPGVWELRTRMLSTGDDDHFPGTSAARLIFVSR
jgi:hypothetical protein